MAENFAKDGKLKVLAFIDSQKTSADLKKTLEKLEGEVNNLEVSYLDVEGDEFRVEKEGLLVVPATKISKRDYNITYYGVQKKKEYRAYKDILKFVSSGKTKLSNPTKKAIKKYRFPLNILIFTTPSCTYCPKAVRVATQFAIESDYIKSAFVDASEFTDMAEEYDGPYCKTFKRTPS